MVGQPDNDDTVPDSFSFDAQTDVELNQVLISNAVVISGINAPSSIDVGNGEYSVDNGELLIEKTGIEPWFLMTQIIERDQIPGKTVVFSAEIKLDMRPPEKPHGFKQGGGLILTGMANNRPVVSLTMEHEPHMGSTDWQRVQMQAELPRSVQKVRLGFIHQADGSFSVRNPSLQRTKKGECD